MCQQNSMKCDSAEVYGYRVYRVDCFGMLRSVFMEHLITPIGKEVENNDTDQPFHIFTDIDAANEIKSWSWHKDKELKVFRVRLRGNLYYGNWDNMIYNNKDLMSYTGNKLTVLYEVKGTTVNKRWEKIKDFIYTMRYNYVCK